MSTAKFNVWQNPDGTENYKCRAWVNFNGTGTVAIRAAGNVSSVTDNGVGNYTVNLTTAMTDANYATLFQNGSDVFAVTANNAQLLICRTDQSTISAVRIIGYFTDTSGIGQAFDPPTVYAAIFR